MHGSSCDGERDERRVLAMGARTNIDHVTSTKYDYAIGFPRVSWSRHVCSDGVHRTTNSQALGYHPAPVAVLGADRCLRSDLYREARNRTLSQNLLVPRPRDASHFGAAAHSTLCSPS